MASVPSPFLTPEQYLEIDSRAELPSEYYDGVMYPIEATSVRHSDIQFNFRLAIRKRFNSASPCKSVGPTVRAKLPNSRYAYPDIIVVCGKMDLDDKKYDTILNPTVIVEILSPSTGDFDRGGKAELYRALPSLKDYVIVAQDRPRVEWYARQGERRWILEELTGTDAVLRLDSIGVEIPLTEIYEGVNFDPEA